MSPSRPTRKRGAEALEASNSKMPKGIHPFFLKPSEKPPASFVWRKTTGSTCLHGVHLDPKPSQKVAAFDLDGTLIKTKSGNGFPRDKDDWMWWRTSVRKQLTDLHEEGFSIVIFSNQASLRQKKLDEWRLKLLSIASQIPNVPFRIFAALQHDFFRKPMPGMWLEFEKLNHPAAVDKKLSFFVGDAAGRPGDFSDTDRKWALNAGLPFLTPEEYFLGSNPIPFTLKGFDPPTSHNDGPLFTPTSSPLLPIRSAHPEVVLFVGYPASGKTSFYRRHFQPAGYEHVNQDTLKTRAKCIKTVGKLIVEGKSCVVDNTNRDLETRREYVDLCKSLGVTIRCLVFSTPLEMCWHNNLYRAFCLSPDQQAKESSRSLLPQVAFTSFRDNYQEPTIDEGFAEIKTVNFRFEDTEEERRRWNMWLEIDQIAWLNKQE